MKMVADIISATIIIFNHNIVARTLHLLRRVVGNWVIFYLKVSKSKHIKFVNAY
jgi:hypothetical protein